MDYEIDYEEQCPKCGHSPLHHRSCTEIHCDDGYVEEFYDDIEIEGMGEEVPCRECRGTGVEWWCPSCGENLSGRINGNGQEPDDDDDW